MTRQPKSMVPKVRFKGFTDEWEQQKSEKIFKERKEKSDNKQLLSVSINNGVTLFDETGRKNNSSKDKHNYRLVLPGDIAYNSMRMWQGALGVSNLEGIVSPAYTVITPKQNEEAYFYYYMFKRKSSLDTFQRHSQGLTSDTWNLKFPLFKSIIFYTTNAKEQTRIASLLLKLDSVITLQQHKLDQLNTLKKGLLQKMFADKKHSKPELRFKGFSGDWEQRKLGDVVEITMGQSPDGKTYSDTPSEYILVQGNADLVNGWVKPRIWTTQITKEAHKGAIILSVRAPAGEVGRTKYDVVLGRGVAGIEGNEFIYQLLFRMSKTGYWNKYATGSTFASLNSKDVSNAQITVTNTQEEKQIGSLFSKIDNLVDLQQSKLDKLNSLKKSLLQNMFI